MSRRVTSLTFAGSHRNPVAVLFKYFAVVMARFYSYSSNEYGVSVGCYRGVCYKYECSPYRSCNVLLCVVIYRRERPGGGNPKRNFVREVRLQACNLLTKRASVSHVVPMPRRVQCPTNLR